MVGNDRVISGLVVGAQEGPSSLWAAVLRAPVEKVTMEEDGVPGSQLHVQRFARARQLLHALRVCRDLSSHRHVIYPPGFMGATQYLTYIII